MGVDHVFFLSYFDFVFLAIYRDRDKKRQKRTKKDKKRQKRTKNDKKKCENKKTKRAKQYVFFVFYCLLLSFIVFLTI